jgi:tetratricopeptide (TPR) repeat protein
MPRSKGKPAAALIDHMLGEASWLLSHAQALTDYGRRDEAAVELARAAAAEEQVAGLLDADGQDLEAAIHRVSAASCYEKLGQSTRAVTLLRAALAGPLHDDYRARVEELLTRCLAQVHKELRRTVKNGSRKRSSVVP